MEGGHIVQVGTASQIVRNPAGPYVADFVAHVNPMIVLTAEDAMVSIMGASLETPLASAVSRDTPLRRVMETLQRRGGEVLVSEKGHIVGRVGPAEVVAALVRERASTNGQTTA